RLAGFDLDSLLAEQGVDRMRRLELPLGGNGRALLPRPHQPRIGPRPEREFDRVEQDRLARAGFSGKHAEAKLELELQPLDEDDIVDGELPQHVRCARSGITSARPSVRCAAFLGPAISAPACTNRCPESWPRA